MLNPLESLLFLTFLISCQREGRQFESGLVLHTKKACHAKHGGLFSYLSLVLVLARDARVQGIANVRANL